MGSATGALLARERRKLQELQATTRDALGLPRASGEHPATRWLKMQLAFLVLIIFAQIPHSMMMTFISQGSLNEFPNRLTFALSTMVTLVAIHIVLPFGLYLSDAGYRAHVARAFRDPVDTLWCYWQ